MPSAEGASAHPQLAQGRCLRGRRAGTHPVRTVVAIPADLSAEAECLRLAGKIGQREHALNVLVNDAGAAWGAPMEEFPATAWDKVVDLNLKALFLAATLKTLGDVTADAAPLKRIGRPTTWPGSRST